jgi:beta-lactamase class A
LDNGVNSLLEHRKGTIEVAIEDVSTGTILTFGPQEPQDEASVVKVNILAALLSASTSSPALSPTNQTLAQEMIEASDNTAATDLWTAAGGSKGIGAFDRRIGLTSTKPSSCVQCAGFPWPGWGLTTTTPLDEIKLMKAAFFDPEILNSENRGFQLQLMEAVIPSERWGVTSGVPSIATVALKNGWLPLNGTDTNWQINSVGWVRGDGRNYLIALFSTGNPSEDYGIQSLDEISASVWDHMSH